MIVASAIQKMIDFYDGNLPDIAHFLKVWALAKTIGTQEGLDMQTQQTLELAAVVHDIACPLCREKYGNTNGKKQELESSPLVRQFFASFSLSARETDRIVWLAAHHHTYVPVDGPDHQILLEADFLVNAGESGYSAAVTQNAQTQIFRTASGLRLLKSMYLKDAAHT